MSILSAQDTVGLLISGAPYDGPWIVSGWLMTGSTALVVIGTSILMIADCQKRLSLQVRRGLTTQGLFSKVRRPNYPGESMVYGGFALLAGPVWPSFVLACWWTSVFPANMIVIESSLARYPEWPEYKARSGMLLPELR